MPASTVGSTSNTQAIGIVNTMINNLSQLYLTYLSVKSTTAQWGNLPGTLAPTLAGFDTATVNADGSLGAQDATPNSAHPMNVTKYTALTRALSQGDIVSLNTFFGALINLMEGVAVPTQTQAPQLIAKIIGQ